MQVVIDISEEMYDDIKEGYACAYVKNLSDDFCSEFGSICFKKQFGGLVRTA